ncbi:MAG: argininosuccinate lyase [Acidobacteria bacterium]|nr:argininosuccinate lyase [Acidobacteriota bacterium]
MWGGRFRQTPSDLLRRLNDSFAVDRALLEEDVQGSIAWAQALGRADALSRTEVSKLVSALRDIGRRPPGPGETGKHEDVHSFVEYQLSKRVGALAGKLHTGRSRNDQVATDFKLYLKKALQEACLLTLDVSDTLIERATSEAATAMPGYTHLKRAEPVTFGHWCLAYVEMLLRDVQRFAQARARGDECPLGSGALAGTPVGIDRKALARELNFSRPTANSLDAVSDRDMAVEYLFDCSLLLAHLSRLAEDLILFSSDECQFIDLPDSLATGSSRMPHKKNPDVLELARGYAGRAIGDLAGLLSILKGLPLAYNKDLQLDKEPVFRSRQVLGLTLPVIAELVRGMEINCRRMHRAASGDLILATALVDRLAARGIPFRKAHEMVGRRIVEASRANQNLRDLGPSAEITGDDLRAMRVELVLGKRNVLGGTAPARVRKAAAEARRRSAKLRRAHA